MNASSSRRAAFVALTYACVVAVGACGGKSSNSSSPTAPTSSSSSSGGASGSGSSGGNACGAISGFTGTPETIYNGTDCNAQMATTSVVWLYLLDANGSAIKWCSGTVIDTQWVLTAAHCLSSDVKGVAAWLGAGMPVTATEFHASPAYNGMGSTSLDVGVVKFEAALGRPVVPLLTSREATAGETGVIAGWGNGITVSDPSGVLRAGTVTIASTTTAYIQSNYLPSGSNVCNGDSGGPLLLQQNGAWCVAGIISSTTTGCISGSSDFAKVRYSGILNFILGYVPNAAQR